MDEMVVVGKGEFGGMGVRYLWKNDGCEVGGGGGRGGGVFGEDGCVVCYA